MDKLLDRLEGLTTTGPAFETNLANGAIISPLSECVKERGLVITRKYSRPASSREVAE
jgi:hypothetical protein